VLPVSNDDIGGVSKKLPQSRASSQFQLRESMVPFAALRRADFGLVGYTVPIVAERCPRVNKYSATDAALPGKRLSFGPRNLFSGGEYDAKGVPGPALMASP
jgi:hypothetical protein